jgi:quinol monooxygenase YgiN
MTVRGQKGAAMPVRMTVEWYVPPGQARQITAALNQMMAETRTAHGCLGCSVSTGVREAGVVCYVEEWRSEDDLRHRLESGNFVELAALIDNAATPPRVEFALSGGTRGLDFAKEVRRRNEALGAKSER